MPDREYMKSRLETLLTRDWDLVAIQARYRNLIDHGIVKKNLDKKDILSRKQDILDRVQLRAEEYCYLTRSCAKGSATALLEEFGLGHTDCIKALSPFPGFAMTGEICGPVTGGLMALGLYFSSEDPSDYQDVAAYPAARIFLQRFKDTFGSLSCADIQALLLGRYYDPMAGRQNMLDFNNAKARQKCPLAPGLGARIAAEIIIESMEQK
ncbi:MAG: C_GCAxxG_C_C family protein [Deltaproteobacteria bacterium]|nr:C_GCAxxG_C_C family protein [Deltaproteobacteria bacterium]